MLGHIDACSDEPLHPGVCGWRADPPYMTNRSVGAHDPLREVESARLGQHRLNLLRDELPIVRMYEREIFLGGRWFAVWIQAINRKQLGRPLLETGGIECPATGVREPLSLRQVELGLLAVVDVHARSVPLDDLAARISQRQLMVQHPAVCTVRAPDARFELERLAAHQALPPLRDERVHVVRMDRGRPFPPLEVLQSQPHELEPPLIEEIQVPVRAGRMDQGGNRLDELMQPVEV